MQEFFVGPRGFVEAAIRYFVVTAHPGMTKSRIASLSSQ
jgi:hypothetical protein